MSEKRFILQLSQLMLLCLSLVVIVACRDGGIIDINREREAQIEDVENISFTPDPATGRAGTSISYLLKNDVNAITVKIYSAEGSLIKNIEGLPIKKSAVPYSVGNWDLTDWRGVAVANGQYSYKFIYKKGESEYAQSGKIAVSR